MRNCGNLITMTDDFYYNENLKRSSSYYKDEDQQNLLWRINRALSKLELPVVSKSLFPTLFIFGLPRSGTTLTYQLLSNCLDIGYINNLMAKFWLAPICGIELSKAILGEVIDISFKSNLGRTNEPTGPHEFSYFWQYWLKVKGLEDMLTFDSSKKEIDWDGLGKQVRNMQNTFGKGMLFKTMYAGNHLEAFSKTFSMPLFIYIERELDDVALSILSARKAYYRNVDTWWATYPPNYKDIKHRKFSEQIAGQVLGLKRTYEELINKLDSRLVFRLKYSELCDNPSSVISSIQEKVFSVHKFAISTRNTPPKRFDERKKIAKNKDEKDVLDAIQKQSF